MTVTKGYLSDGSSLVEDAAGVSETQLWNVPADEGQGSSFLWIAAANNGPPRLNDPHPRDPRMVVLSRVISDLGGGLARIVVNYGIPGTGVESDASEALGSIVDVRYDGAVTTEKRKTDIYGEPIISGTSAYNVSINVATSIVEVDRIESTPPDVSVISLFMNKVNSSAFNGYPARTLLMYAPRSRVINATSNFVVTYIFAIELKTWDNILEVVTLDTELASSGASTSGATKIVVKGIDVTTTAFRLYEEIDFNQLGLDF